MGCHRLEYARYLIDRWWFFSRVPFSCLRVFVCVCQRRHSLSVESSSLDLYSARLSREENRRFLVRRSAWLSDVNAALSQVCLRLLSMPLASYVLMDRDPTWKDSSSAREMTEENDWKHWSHGHHSHWSCATRRNRAETIHRWWWWIAIEECFTLSVELNTFESRAATCLVRPDWWPGNELELPAPDAGPAEGVVEPEYRYREKKRRNQDASYQLHLVVLLDLHLFVDVAIV